MNEMEELEKVLTGENVGQATSGAENGGADASAARIAELEKQLQRERVEQGRLNKANEELAQLRKENEALKAEKGRASVLDRVSQESLEGIPDNIQRFTSEAVDAAVKAERERHEKEMEGMRAASADQARRLFNERMDGSFPGLLAKIRPGGELAEAWAKYQRPNAASIVGAIRNGDFETLKWHIEHFQAESGVSITSGDGGKATTADPRSMGGGVAQPQGGVGKTYTVAEYTRLMDQAQSKFQRHELSGNDYRGICAELEKAYREGRVKG